MATMMPMRSSSTHVEMESTTTTRSTSSKELGEHVVHIMMASLSTSLFVFFHALFAVHIINLSFIFVAQRLVSISNFLKLLLCPIRVICVFVGVILNGHFLESFFDLSICGVSFDSQQLVVIFALFFWLLFHILLILPPLLLLPLVFTASLLESKLSLHRSDQGNGRLPNKHQDGKRS